MFMLAGFLVGVVFYDLLDGAKGSHNHRDCVYVLHLNAKLFEDLPMHVCSCLFVVVGVFSFSQFRTAETRMSMARRNGHIVCI